jgi:hypothetical protein
MVTSAKLTNLQLELIKTFARPIPENQVLEIRKILADYFAKKIDDDVDALFEANQWDSSKTNEWLNEHLRTPYQSES